MNIAKIPRTFPPSTVMADPDTLREKLVTYFTMLKQTTDEDGNPVPQLPTPPGMAMAMGLNSFDQILKILKMEDDSPGTYPEDSMMILHYARSRIEDAYIQLGLREAIPQSFTKFLLSAYFARSERIISEQQGAPDNNLNINILGINGPTTKAVDSIDHQDEFAYL